MSKSKVGQFFNFGGVGFAFRFLKNPAERTLLLPHVRLESLDEMDWEKFKSLGFNHVCFDKDNTLTAPYSHQLDASIVRSFEHCKEVLGRDNVVLFSNTAGSPDDADGFEARSLEKSLGIKVLRHEKRKPYGGDDLRSVFSDMSRVIVVGDRYFTDVLFANLNGCLSVYVKPLPHKENFMVIKILNGRTNY